MRWPEPAPDNHFLNAHIKLVCASFQHWTGDDLVLSKAPVSDVAQWLYHAPFVLVSHGTESDPIFNYANLSAQKLFEMDWNSFVTTPSRLSAEPAVMEERQRLLQEVTTNGYISNYCGVRITASRKRFWIKNAIVWNLLDREGEYYGQAAMFDQWHWIV